MHPISTPLLDWFDEFGRKNLPWQATYCTSNTQQLPRGGQVKHTNPYFVWLSEIMLQQTQVTTVIDYFNSFIRQFPNIQSLASAHEDAVLAQWAGLGYYARARNLHKTAKIIVDEYQGVFPAEFEQVLKLPGIGQSTAGAILSISFGQKHAILDGNVKRVIARYHQVSGHYAQSTTLKRLWCLAKIHTPNSRNADYTQAIMDLGATLCTRSNPSCQRCPLAVHCEANKYATQAQYPNPKPKKPKPTREIAMLIFTNNAGEIYLEKRPDKGIWGGLWSLIECENQPTIINHTIRQFDNNARIKKSLPVFRHSFTHYHLLINPVVVHSLNDRQGFHQIAKSGAKLNIGLPAPVSKILTKIIV